MLLQKCLAVVSSSRVLQRILSPISLRPPHCRRCHNSRTTIDGRWTFSDLPTYGRVVLRRSSPRPVQFNLSPLSPHDYPSQNQASVTVCGGHANDTANVSCTVTDGVLFVSDADTPDVALSSGERISMGPLECQIEIPLKYDCDVSLEGHSGVSISDLENQDLDIQLQHGDCRLKNIKTANVQIRSETGSIVSESLLQGNAFIQSETGSINLHKPVSQTLTIQTTEGNVHVQNLYAEKSNIVTHHSNVHIGSCHRNAQVDINYQGNLKIDSIDGALRVNIKSGNTEILVAQHEWINISTGAGDITVNIPESRASTLEITGDEAIVDKKLTIKDRTEENTTNHQLAIKGILLGDGKMPRSTMTDVGHLHIQTNNGRVELKCQDWLSSLKLGTQKNNF